ncbi:hypothetical protein G9A89_001927 [Geosiphon pyriformis]|nr:hypothetical protein G9A89_001927 [Geosiphon pyriformis]
MNICMATECAQSSTLSLKRLNFKSPIPTWFVSVANFIKNSGLNNDVAMTSSFALANFVCDTGFVSEWLLATKHGSINVYMDGFVKVLRLLSSILVELQAIALALECVPNSSTVIFVWHPDGEICFGYTSLSSASLWSYLIKSLHCQLPVVMKKRLYDSKYPSIVYIRCGMVEDSDYLFLCMYDNIARLNILSNIGVKWYKMAGDSAVRSKVVQFLSKAEFFENLESKKTESEQKKTTENEEKIATAYIAKIPEFTGENNDISPQEWLDKVQKAEDTNETNDYYSNAQILNQFIAELKDKLIKKVCSHAPEDLTTAIRHIKNYEMAMEEANHTKLVNLAIGETSSAAEKKIDQLTKKVDKPTNNNCSNYKDINHHNNATKTILDHHLTTNLKVVIIVKFQDTGNEIAENCKETNKTKIINTTKSKQLLSTSFTTNATTILAAFTNSAISNTIHSTILSTSQKIVLRNSVQQKPIQFYTQPSEVVAPRSNSFNNTIPPAQIAQNANFLDIFSFEFEANESLFLLSNAAINEQKTITAMYTEAIVEGKPIQLILDSRFTGSIITYQLMQQLQKTVDRSAQTVIVIADDMKKTLVGKIDNFPFIIDGITISVKVLVMDAPQYQALIENDWLLKANAKLD